MSKVYQAIHSAFVAARNCENCGFLKLQARHEERVAQLERECLPSGGGFDAGTAFDADVSTAGRLVFDTSFHHMNEHGSYVGWSEHRVLVTPTFEGIEVKVTGRDRNGIKEYIADVFHEALSAEAPARAA